MIDIADPDIASIPGDRMIYLCVIEEMIMIGDTTSAVSLLDCYRAQFPQGKIPRHQRYCALMRLEARTKDKAVLARFFEVYGPVPRYAH